MPESEPEPPTQPDGRTPHDGAADRPAEVVGEYELQCELAAGGMGVVYRARQRNLNRVVALKMLLPGRLTSDVGRARFRAEAEATAELDHPNIVPIFEVGEHAGRPFFTMKLIDGGTLADLLRRSPRPPLRDLVAAVAKVCRAVHFAHQRGILHRDLKPGNVLVDAAGEPFVADFGLAKRVGADDGLTATGALLGTPAYMAPEQAGDTGHGVTTLTDVYALGAILYEVLTGRPPFASRDLGSLLAQIRGDAPVPPSSVGGEVPRDLELVCLKCLGKVPADRYASARELAEELDRWLRGEPVEVRAPGALARAAAWLRHNSRAAVWVSLIGVVWGVCGPQLPIVLATLGTMMHGAADAAARFPGADPPWLLRVRWAVPPGAFVAVLAVSAALHLLVGMATHLATRSGDRDARLGWAAAAGLIAGVLAFTLYIGPAAVIATAVVPAIGDLDLLAEASARNAPPAGATGPTPDRVLEQYPELAAVPERDRGRLLRGRVLVANIVGVYEGLVLGMVLTLAYAMPVAVGGTLLAAAVVRRTGSPAAALVPYLEVSMAVSVGWLDLVILLLDASGSIRLRGIGFEGWVMTVFLLTAPPWVVLRGWQLRDRWRTYGLGMGAVILLDLWTSDPEAHVAGARWAGLAAFALVAAATARRWWRAAPVPPPHAPHADPTRTLTAPPAVPPTRTDA
ncbi:protein kinase domain-containing protein [Gemmata sp.]|uniref:serine/threonine-protein kinase n=1 Tax=Gemmata sp. TaxID=1914242 RepID=UPI003F71EF31